MESSLFGFWLRFSSVTGFFKNLLLRRSLAKKPKILAPHRYIFSVNALMRRIAQPMKFLCALPSSKLCFKLKPH